MWLDYCLGRNRQLFILIKKQKSCIRRNGSCIVLNINFNSNFHKNDDIAEVFAS